MKTAETIRPNDSPDQRKAWRGLPAGIWALGLVSMCMDISSELIHSLLPVFMASVLNASMTTVGVVEGVGEATAAITKIFSGALSDYLGRRKLLALIGYGLAALTKPIFPLASSIQWVFAGRFIDRIGKGIRGAPRDALVADLTPPRQRGAAYGLRQSLDSVGAFVGPLIAVVCMGLLANNIRRVFWLAVIPAFLAVLVLFLGVHEPEHSGDTAASRNSVSLAKLRLMPLRFWLVVLLGALATLARFSEAFLVLRALDVGLGVGYVPLVLIVMNIVYTASAYPAGVAADRFNPRMLLSLGLVLLIVADCVLAAASSWPVVFGGTALWGLHMGLTQGLFAKLVADTAPDELRGTAFGIFNLVSGVAMLLASILAGALWSTFGPSATFLAAAFFAVLALLGLRAKVNKPSAFL